MSTLTKPVAAQTTRSCQDSTPRPSEVVTVLSVSPVETDHRALQSIFAQSNWRLHRALRCHDAFDFLYSQAIPVVIAESELDGQCWKSVLRRLQDLPRPRPRLIVAARLADDNLWSEVLNLGGYNVLEKPFDRREVFWVVSHAWLDWKSELERGMNSQLQALSRSTGI